MAIYFGDGSGGGDTTEGRILQIQRITKTDTFSSNSDSFTDLTGMSVNYTNAGTYASYEDGSPVSIRLNMTFKELNPIYSEDYDGMGESDGVGF